MGLRWPPAYFDHRLRPDEDRLPVFIYIYLNPYRAKLLTPDQVWSGYFCGEDEWKWFEPLTDYSCPQPEWLEEESGRKSPSYILQIDPTGHPSLPITAQPPQAPPNL